MKYFIVLVLIVASVAGIPVEGESKNKEKRGIFSAAPLFHAAPLTLPEIHAAPLALPAIHAEPLALPAYHSAPIALPAPIISAPIAHAPLYGFGHSFAYGGLLH